MIDQDEAVRSAGRVRVRVRSFKSKSSDSEVIDADVIFSGF